MYVGGNQAELLLTVLVYKVYCLKEKGDYGNYELVILPECKNQFCVKVYK